MVDKKIFAVILAAGSSSRLGRAKQLLKFGDYSLLEKISTVVSEVVGPRNTILVLGDKAEEISRLSKINPAIQQVTNIDWGSGMSSSIRIGLQEALKQPCDAVLFVLCDQPFVDAALLKNMIHTHHEKKGIIACNYNGKNGVPAIFDHRFFTSLLALKGQDGAKKIIESNSGEVTSISFPLGAWDVDTEEDVYRLLNFMNSSELS